MPKEKQYIWRIESKHHHSFKWETFRVTDKPVPYEELRRIAAPSLEVSFRVVQYEITPVTYQFP